MLNTNKFIITMAKQQNGSTSNNDYLKNIIKSEVEVQKEKQTKKSVKEYINEGIEKINQQL